MEELNIVKKPYQIETFTKDQIEEIKKCANDPKYFIKKYVMIRTMTGASLFKLYPFQEDIIDVFHNYKNSVMLTARQMGKCVTSDTEITIDDKKMSFEEIVPMTPKEKLINYLEQKLLQLSK